MSLASDDAEDDGSHGNRSVPAMLRTIRECIHVHMDVVTQSRASLSTEILSTHELHDLHGTEPLDLRQMLGSGM